jgi:hypothetical protein
MKKLKLLLSVIALFSAFYANAQDVIITPNSYIFPTITVGTKDSVEFDVVLENRSYAMARLINNSQNPNGTFFLPSTSVVNGTQLKVKFQPSAEGVFTAQLEIWGYDASYHDVSLAVVNISGEAVGTTPPPEKQGDEWLPMDAADPLASMNETFNNITNNQPLAVNRWKNIAQENYRAWWGYNHADTAFTAKATAYVMNGEPQYFEMWLVTPPLDYVNAASKWFSFREMANLMSEGDNAKLQIYYIELDNEGKPDTTELVGFNFPAGSDNNKLWSDYYFDLSAINMPIAPVFYIGFKMSATGGSSSATSYYIDDVTWGIYQPSALAEISDNSVVAWAKDGKIFISSENSGSAALYNIAGVMLENYDFSHGISEFPADFQSGIYLLKIKHNNNYSTKKIIIK